MRYRATCRQVWLLQHSFWYSMQKVFFLLVTFYFLLHFKWNWNSCIINYLLPAVILATSWSIVSPITDSSESVNSSSELNRSSDFTFMRDLCSWKLLVDGRFVKSSWPVNNIIFESICTFIRLHVVSQKVNKKN